MLFPALDYWREKNGHSHACKALWCCRKSMCEYVTLIFSYENIRSCTVNIWNNWPKDLLTVFLMRDLCKSSFKGKLEPHCFTLQLTRRCRILCASPEQIGFIWNVAWNWPRIRLPACLKLPLCLIILFSAFWLATYFKSQQKDLYEHKVSQIKWVYTEIRLSSMVNVCISMYTLSKFTHLQ